MRVDATQGSVPREAGTWMAVWADGTLTGTIGGGQLEFAGHRATRATGWPAARAIDGAAALSRSAPAWGSAAAAWCALRFERGRRGRRAGAARRAGRRA